MKNLFKNKIILSFIFLNIIPLFFSIIDLYYNNYYDFKTFIFYLNSNNSIFGYFSSYTSSIFLTIFLIIYNLGISFFLYYISEFTKKHIISISIIIAIFSSFFGGLLTTL